MIKKMTTKEFKEAFTSCGYDFGIWQWDGILNMIACYANLCAEREEKQVMMYQLELSTNGRTQFISTWTQGITTINT